MKHSPEMVPSNDNQEGKRATLLKELRSINAMTRQTRRSSDELARNPEGISPERVHELIEANNQAVIEQHKVRARLAVELGITDLHEAENL